MNTFSYSNIDVFVSLVLALIMFGIGMSIHFNAIKLFLKSPRSIAFGLLVQLIGLPLIAFIITFFSNLPVELKVGFIILAAAPGGTTSGFINHIFKGNVVLSVSLAAINSVITPFSIPLVVNAALLFYYGNSAAIHLPLGYTIVQILFVVIIPIALGLMFRYTWNHFSQRLEQPLKIVMALLLATVFLIKFFADVENGGSGITMSEILKILPFALAINIIGFLLGLFVGHINKNGIVNSFTIGIEVAMQNTTLAFLVAGTLLQNQEMIKPSLVYSMFSFWTALIFGFVVKYLNNKKLFAKFSEK